MEKNYKKKRPETLVGGRVSYPKNKKLNRFQNIY